MPIRPMTAADVGGVARLAAQLGYPAIAADVERRFATIAADPDHAAFVAEGSAGQVVGWVHVHGRRLLEADPFAELGGLVVDEGCRSQGVGGALLAAAERWAAAHGYAMVTVRSNALRLEAHRFYRERGYTRVKAQQVFRKVVQAGLLAEGDLPPGA